LICILALLFTGLPQALPRADDPAALMMKVARTAEKRWPDADTRQDHRPYLWNYTRSVLLMGFERASEVSTVPDLEEYIRSSTDRVVLPEGGVRDFPNEPHSLDQIPGGRQLLYEYAKTHEARYGTAAGHVFDELMVQPRNRAGGFWHKQIYPAQMWLDGLYMAEPFYAEYAVTFGERRDAFGDITHQFVTVEQHARDPRTGLLFHGWDESHQQAWADKQTGLSSQFWGRSIGWFAMALVDTLPYYAKDDPGRAQLVAMLNRLAVAVAKVQDPANGLWWQVMDRAGAPGNYEEASASAMFLYALAKGVRLGYLPTAYLDNVHRGWNGYVTKFLQPGEDGSMHVNGIVRSAGLGGTPYRSGSYDYYTHEGVVTDDPQGVGSFLMAASEMVRLENKSTSSKPVGRTPPAR
jgi:unsaturated rhamnogalacturonyl hydrolase